MTAATLAVLPPGQQARIAGFVGLPAETADHLLALGFDTGVDVETLHRAPLGGDPIAVKVGGTIVALRVRLARAIRLGPADPA